MNPIVFSLPNPPTIDFYQKKLALNEEFQHKAKIQGLVSYIYYPSQRRPTAGHVELEIEGYSYTLIDDPIPIETPIPRSLSKMIKKSVSGKGRLFFRFPISVTPEQLKNLRKNGPETQGWNCSAGAAKALGKHGQYFIPIFINLSPLISATYLATAKMLGSCRIGRIEFYGIKNLKMGVAPIIEGSYIIASLYAIKICACISIDSISKMYKLYAILSRASRYCIINDNPFSPPEDICL